MSIKPSNNRQPSEIMLDIVCDFLLQKTLNGVKPKNNLFNWSDNSNISEQIAFRTFKKTIFKNYRGNKYGLYTSLE
jgi:hypothetical protein